MWQEPVLSSSLLIAITKSSKLIVSLSFIIVLLSSLSHSASIMTLSSSSSSTYHHFELLSNNSYRNFFLRQYFIDLLNISHSSLIQSMITNHDLTINLEQIKTRRRRDEMIQSLSSIAMLTLPSKNCSIANHNQVQSTFQWSHSITTLSSVELIYQINSSERRESSIPLRIVIRQLQTFNEVFSIDTYLQFDSIRDFYFINMYDYLFQINNQNLIIETIIRNQTCQILHTYMVLSSVRSNQLSSYDREQKTICKLKTIQIKFEELGLAHLIIRPKEYTFSYCDGSCANLTVQRTSLHAFLQSMISKKKSHIPQPHCAPSQYADDNFLLRQPDGSMGIYPIKDVIVKQCACL